MRAELEKSFGESLSELAGWCRDCGLNSQAAVARDWQRARDPRRIYLVYLPAAVGEPAPADDVSPDILQWNKRFGELRREHADNLFQLARQSLRQKRASLAMELVLDAAREDPDHAGARRMLGYQQVRGFWRTTYEARQLRLGKVWHDKYGWLLKAHVKRYEDGLRYTGRRWVTAEEDAKLHADINSGWKVETDHYVVTTNHSLEAGVKLGTHLEDLYRAWRQVFVRYYASEAELAQLLENRAAAKLPQTRHAVIYFRDSEEYRQALRGSVPAEIVTTGIYLGDHRTAYFFASDADDPSTLYHEATHQLFSETRPVVRDIGREANFWIVEGAACYMESFTPHEGYYTLGGSDTLRYQGARYRLLEDDFYIPLADLSTWGMQKLQTEPRISMVYSQSAGLTHFLMHYQDGRYRDVLVTFLEAIYTGRATAGTLAELTGESYEDLDRQYREFMAQDEVRSEVGGRKSEEAATADQ